MGGTNEHQETFVLHLRALRKMPNITIEAVGNVIEGGIWFSVRLSLSCSLRVVQVQTTAKNVFFPEVC